LSGFYKKGLIRRFADHLRRRDHVSSVTAEDFALMMSRETLSSADRRSLPASHFEVTMDDAGDSP